MRVEMIVSRVLFWGGLVSILLLLTPVLGVVVALVGFWTAGDRRYTVIAGIILVELVVSFLLGSAG